MPRQIKVTLGGREYTLESLPIRQSKVWRDKLAVPFAMLSQAIQTAGVVELTVAQLPDISRLVRQFSGVLLGSVDTMLDLLFEYSSALRDDRDWIEENAYDEEALNAFTEALKLAYPLGQLLQTIRGPSQTTTSQSLRSQNGASGTKHLAKKHRA